MICRGKAVIRSTNNCTVMAPLSEIPAYADAAFLWLGIHDRNANARLIVMGATDRSLPFVCLSVRMRVQIFIKQ